jgi:dimethylaniline monooxygenase (N-oxide forming)
MTAILKRTKPIVVIGGGSGGLAATKALLDEGLAPLLLEASDDIGGQWNTTASHSGIWPGMATNTSKATTVFSDLAHTKETPMFPSALQIGAYLHRYADTFGLKEHVRTGAHVEHIERQKGNGFRVHYQDRGGQHIVEASAVVVASGRYNKPKIPRQITELDSFSGRSGSYTPLTIPVQRRLQANAC